MRREIVAQTGFNDQVPSGKGLLSFVPGTDNLIDAMANQKTVMRETIARRRAEMRHQAAIQEVA